jgi:hypothetical protein
VFPAFDAVERFRADAGAAGKKDKAGEWLKKLEAMKDLDRRSRDGAASIRGLLPLE